MPDHKKATQMSRDEYAKARTAAIRARPNPESIVALRREIAERRGEKPKNARDMTAAEYRAERSKAIRGQ
jgi:hypothetical protein